jgi:hypothetical protein
MTKQQKEQLAGLLISQAGNLVEFWAEQGVDGLDKQEAAEQLAKWLSKLPGTEWDTRLPMVDKK